MTVSGGDEWVRELVERAFGKADASRTEHERTTRLSRTARRLFFDDGDMAKRIACAAWLGRGLVPLRPGELEDCNEIEFHLPGRSMLDRGFYARPTVKPPVRDEPIRANIVLLHRGPRAVAVPTLTDGQRASVSEWLEDLADRGTL